MSLNLRAGGLVEVRSKDEILATLDSKGQLNGLPFMPEMLAFCGRRLRVYKRAHKTCDTVNDYKGRRMTETVHLEGVRCDGRSHGGCEAGCLIFWKEAWLKQIEETGPMNSEALIPLSSNGSCSEQKLLAETCIASEAGHPVRYICQATQLPAATSALNAWDIRQYIEDYTSGNTALPKLARGFVYMTYNGLINLGIGLGAPLRWFYDVFQRMRGGLPYPRRKGRIPPGQRTPTVDLGLKEGEWVRVKGYEEILATCDTENRNRGLTFDAEMVPYCGEIHRVLKRVTRIINEKTGEMMNMKIPSILLENVACQARYSNCRMFCPRAIYSFWREAWLERVVVAPTFSNTESSSFKAGTRPRQVDSPKPQIIT